MQVVILCGGSGTRLREQTEFLPKPLIQIGGKPMIYHIMKIYSHCGYKDFILALGYKQEMFKEYFAHFNEINNDCVMHVGNYQGMTHQETTDNWKITLSDTGLNTLKGERLKKVEKYVMGDTFMMTYGDGVADINLTSLLEYHKQHGKIATVTGVRPKPRFGEISHTEGRVLSFSEKKNNGKLINGGFFVFNRSIFTYLQWGDLETRVMEKLADIGQLMVYHHEGAWHCMDTLKETEELNQLWETGRAEWRVW